MSDLPEWAFHHLAAIAGFDPRSPGVRETVLRQVFPVGNFIHAWRYEQGKLQFIRYEEDGYAAIPDAFVRERTGLFRLLSSVLGGRDGTDGRDEPLDLLVSALPLDRWRLDDAESGSASEAPIQAELHLLVVYPSDSFREDQKDATERALDKLRGALELALEDLAEHGLKAEFRVTTSSQGIDVERVDILKEDVLDLAMETTPAHRECHHGEMWVGFARLSQILEHQQALERILGPGTNAILSENIRTWLGHTPTNRSLENAFSTMASAGTVEEFPFLHNGMTLAGLGGVATKDDRTLRIRKPRILNGAQTINAFRAWKDGVGSGKELDPVVLVKVIQEGLSGDDFVRRVTAANNRQNPVESSDIRAADPIHRKLEERISVLGWTYHYRRSWQDRAALKDVKACVLSMRESLPTTWHLVHGRIDESKRAESIFDDEVRYGECFRWFVGESEAQSLRRIQAAAVFWSGLRRLRQMRIYDNAGQVSHPVGEIRSQSLRKQELGDLFRAQVKHLASVILLLRWIEDRGVETLWKLRSRWAPFEEALGEDLRRLARKPDFKEVFSNLLVSDPRFRREQEIEDEDGKRIRVGWNGLSTDKGLDAALQALVERDPAWKWTQW
jgi:hypothetical protein